MTDRIELAAAELADKFGGSADWDGIPKEEIAAMFSAILRRHFAPEPVSGEELERKLLEYMNTKLGYIAGSRSRLIAAHARKIAEGEGVK